MVALSSQTITQLLPESCRKIVVGYSGGVDSHVLLHLCVSEPAIQEKVTAVYIHHGLLPEADDWAEHCREQCSSLGVGFRAIRVDAAANPGESPEEAARDARYSAFRVLLESNDVLLLAQHREDQMETVLLQLFRGCGIHGLAAMPVRNDFGAGVILRPFLNVSKNEIQEYANVHGLGWVDDPSNLNCDFDRNYLRNQVVPLLKRRWPSVDKTVARSAQHCGSAARLLDDWADQSLNAIYDPEDQSFFIGAWAGFDAERRNCLLRHWLKRLGLKPPSQAVLQAIVEQLILAKPSAVPEVRTQGRRIMRYRQKLFCVGDDYFRREAGSRVWEKYDDELLMENGYRLTRTVSSTGIDKRLWDSQLVTVASRCGGERIKLRGRDGRHCIKKLYQEAGLPPWDRAMRPLVYLNGRLAAVAGLWIDEWAWSEGPGDCYRLSWHV